MLTHLYSSAVLIVLHSYQDERMQFLGAAVPNAAHENLGDGILTFEPSCEKILLFVCANNKGAYHLYICIG